MKRLLVTAALVTAVAAGGAVPAHAAPADLGGQCDGTVDVACQEHPCSPDFPCDIVLCGLWVKSRCVL
jgi:hypothetical protein